MLDHLDRVVLAEVSYDYSLLRPLKHPLLSDVLLRQREIAVWNFCVGDARRRRVRCALVAAGLVGCAVVFTTWWLLLPAAGFVAAFARWHRRLGWVDEPPAAIEIVPFGESENAALLLAERPGEFRATCECPGCGEWLLHSLEFADDSPLIIRECAICLRKWSQAS